MPSFKDIPDTGVLDARYANKVLVFVESKEDFEVLQNRWFFEEKEWLEFRSSDEGAGGGCTLVVSNVQKYRKNQVTVFGLVDRDALMRCSNWVSFWEADDLRFKSLQPFGPYVTVLCRWELENYVLDPDELEYILSDSSKEAPRMRREKNEVVRELLEFCQILVPVMAANVLLHENSTGALAMGFGLNFNSRGQLDAEVRRQITHHLQCHCTNTDFLNEYNAHVSRVDAFAGAHPEGSEAKWRSINRIIDGKRILMRVQHKYALNDKLKYDLASRIKRFGSIDPEITELVVSYKSS